jgi:hypothetical protein
MTDPPATITRGPSEAAVEAAQDHFDRPRCRTVIVDSRNTAQALAAAYAVDEPRIRADQTQRIAEFVRGHLTGNGHPAVDALAWADAITREFGGTP